MGLHAVGGAGRWRHAAVVPASSASRLGREEGGTKKKGGRNEGERKGLGPFIEKGGRLRLKGEEMDG